MASITIEPDDHQDSVRTLDDVSIHQPQEPSWHSSSFSIAGAGWDWLESGVECTVRWENKAARASISTADGDPPVAVLQGRTPFRETAAGSA
jgi:hypothetical protein